MGAIAKYYRITNRRGRESVETVEPVEARPLVTSRNIQQWQTVNGEQTGPTPPARTGDRREPGSETERTRRKITQFKQGLERAENAVFCYDGAKRRHNGNIRLSLARSIVAEPRPKQADAEIWESDKAQLIQAIISHSNGETWQDKEIDALARSFVALGGSPRIYTKRQ